MLAARPACTPCWSQPLRGPGFSARLTDGTGPGHPRALSWIPYGPAAGQAFSALSDPGEELVIGRDVKRGYAGQMERLAYPGSRHPGEKKFRPGNSSCRPEARNDDALGRLATRGRLRALSRLARTLASAFPHRENRPWTGCSTPGSQRLLLPSTRAPHHRLDEGAHTPLVRRRSSASCSPELSKPLKLAPRRSVNESVTTH